MKKPVVKFFKKTAGKDPKLGLKQLMLPHMHLYEDLLFLEYQQRIEKAFRSEAGSAPLDCIAHR